MSAAGIEPAPAAKARGLQLGPVLLTLPATAGMLVFFVAPIAIFVVYSFLTAQLYDVSRPFTLDAYSRRARLGPEPHAGRATRS